MLMMTIMYSVEIDGNGSNFGCFTPNLCPNEVGEVKFHKFSN